MQLRYKFVVILLLFLAIIYVNYPNVWELIPSLRQDEAGFYQEKQKKKTNTINAKGASCTQKGWSPPPPPEGGIA